MLIQDEKLIISLQLNPIPSKKELNLKPAIVDIYNKQ
jgi:hypothetical protein